jgi:hypothetical protein
MKKKLISKFILPLSAGCFLFIANVYAQDSVSVDWNKTESISKTTPTLQVVENPMVRPSSPIHENTFKALKI